MPCVPSSIQASSTVATETRRSMWRRCSKSTVCCSMSEKSPHFRRGRYDASTKSSSRTRHIDHFVGFDLLLRLLIGREKTVHLYGPAGFAERVFHKLQS